MNKTIREILDVAFEKWRKQGRTDEQIWAVQNFRTGALVGAEAQINQEINKAEQRGYEKAWEKYDPKTYYPYRQRLAELEKSK